MFAYLDSYGFYIVFLINLIILSGLTLIYNLFRKKYTKLVKLKSILGIWLTSSITIAFLDSIPYLYTDIFEMPIINIIFSNINFGLIGFSVILYELSKYEFPKKVSKNKNISGFLQYFKKNSSNN